MQAPFDFNSLLVPVDFSASSSQAFRQALALASGENAVVILLHVIDRQLVESMIWNELGERDELAASMRRRAQQALEQMRDEEETSVDVEMIVSEGIPFLEIIKKAEDFQIGAIVMGKVGVRGSLEKALFGSTAERVLRGSRRPVVVLPQDLDVG